VADPESRTTKSGGVPFAAFRLASTVRRVNRETGEFEDAATSFVNGVYRQASMDWNASLRASYSVGKVQNPPLLR
jgi:single-stranded DNA-binding protein